MGRGSRASQAQPRGLDQSRARSWGRDGVWLLARPWVVGRGHGREGEAGWDGQKEGWTRRVRVRRGKGRRSEEKERACPMPLCVTVSRRASARFFAFVSTRALPAPPFFFSFFFLLPPLTLTLCFPLVLSPPFHSILPSRPSTVTTTAMSFPTCHAPPSL